MRTKLAAAFVACTIAVASFGPAPSASASTSTLESKAAERLLSIINSNRKARSLRTLKRNSTLVTEARRHAHYLADNRYDKNRSIAHNGFSTRFKRLLSANKDVVSMCENVAFAYYYTDSQMASAMSKMYSLWLNSTAGHKECMFDGRLPNGLRQRATIGGVGVERRSGRWYAVFLAAQDPTP